MSGRPAVAGIISRYYREVVMPTDLEVPQMEMREFAFMYRNNVMVRHRSFSDGRSLRSYLAKYVPMRAFHSVALYSDPSNQDMDAKQWLAADFVIDIDSDKLIEERRCHTYEECMSMTLHTSFELADYIRDVFGDTCEVHFSGRRGFHVICSGALSAADRDVRIKVVDYMMNGYEFMCTAGNQVLKHAIPRCDALVRLGKAFDRNVTIDTSRLIGCINTIHGGSCLKVIKVEREVDDIWRIVDAAKWMKGTMKVKVVKPSTPLDIFQFSEGVQELDAHAACYALAADKAAPIRRV